MRILFIGGTGNISTACTTRALDSGMEVYHLNRGTSPMEGVELITGDIRNRDQVRSELGDIHFDCVVDWVAFTPDHVRNDIDLFRDRTNHYVFISSASVYQKPPSHHVITESTPAHNPFWEYSRNKIECEQLLWNEYAEQGFPMTIVRPSHTYGDGWLPTTFGSRDFTVPQRMLEGKPIVVHGDGQSLWTLTHSEDFAVGFTGLLGNPAAIGETFHITSDEQLTWDRIHQSIGHALGVEPKIVHVTSETIASYSDRFGPGLLGDKRYSVVFDNAKIKRLVPRYHADIPFHEGVRRSLAVLEANPARKTIDQETDELIDRLVAASG